MRITAPRSLFVAPLARRVEAGETVDVDDALAAALVAQGWPAAKAPTKKPGTKPDTGTAPTSEED